MNKTTIKCADLTLTYANGKPWESTYKKTDFQRLLATAEEVAAARLQAEANPQTPQTT